MKSILKNIFGTGDDNEGFVDYEEEGYDTSSSAVTEEEAAADYGSSFSSIGGYGSTSSNSYGKSAINIHAGQQPKIMIMKPQSYDDVINEAISKLREGTIIFLNLNDLDQEQGTRIVDFMTGAAAMCDGRIERADTRCYAVAPKNVEWVNIGL